MKKLSFLFLLLFFIQCKAQSSLKSIEIADLRETVSCKSNKMEFRFPDIYGKNESNFFNQEISKGYQEVAEINGQKAKKPKELLKSVTLKSKENCLKKNDGGLTAVNFEIGINNGKILSLALYYETLAGSLSFENQNYNFDVVNKKNLIVDDLFEKENLKIVAVLIHKELHNRLEDYQKEEKEDDQKTEVGRLLKKSQLFTKEQLNSFKILKEGIVFTADLGLPRGTIPVDGEVLLTFQELSVYLKESFKNMISKN